MSVWWALMRYTPSPNPYMPSYCLFCSSGFQSLRMRRSSTFNPVNTVYPSRFNLSIFDSRFRTVNRSKYWTRISHMAGCLSRHKRSTTIIMPFFKLCIFVLMVSSHFIFGSVHNQSSREAFRDFDNGIYIRKLYAKYDTPRISTHRTINSCEWADSSGWSKFAVRELGQ